MSETSEQVTEAASEESPGLSPERRRQFKIAILVFFLGGLLIGEIISRLHYRGRFPTSTVYHPVRGHAHRPLWEGFEGSPKRGIRSRYNELGLRENRPITREFEGRRVLLLGDSVAFGYRLNHKDTLSVKLEASLNKGAGTKLWQVVNVGCYGYDGEAEANWLSELKDQIKTDIVLVLVCYNDFGLYKKPLEGPPLAASEWLATKSALYMGLLRKVHDIKRAMQRASGDHVTEGQWRRRAEIKPGQEREAAEHVLASLKSMKETCEAMKARMVVTLLPSELQYDTFQKSGELPKEQRIFQELVKEHGIDYRSPYPYLKGGPKAGEIYMDHCHPNPKGTTFLTPFLEQLVKQAG